MEKIQTDFSFKSSSFRILLQPIPGKRQRLPAADGVKPPLGPQARSLLSSTANTQLLLTGTTATGQLASKALL